MIFLAGLVSVSGWAAEVSFETLLRDMTDLERLARFPNPPFTHRLSSSYDRRSTDPDEPTEENWFANVDGSGFVRVEQDRFGREYWVIMDAPGPGAIVRIFSSAPFNGDLFIRIYLDGAEQPAIEMPLIDMLSGTTKPFISPIVQRRSLGWTSYYPIPYAKHCKVTVSKPAIQDIFYYHVNYLTYAPGTTVETYRPHFAYTYRDLISAVASRLADPAVPDLPDEALSYGYEAGLEPGESQILIRKERGPAAVYRFTCRASATDIAYALRHVVIEIVFDSQEPPFVEAPLGDFFGTVPGLNPYQSLPTGVLEDGTMYIHWVMPFRDSVEFRVRNLSAAPVILEGEVVTAPIDWNQRTMYFHAKWRSERDIPTFPRRDWTFIECAGKGQYVGNVYYFLNTADDPLYWGEGDEKVYLDGEAFPSSWGTGTEDYYGTGWGSQATFSHGFYNVVVAGLGTGGYGHNCLSRFHIPDPFPFTTSFKFDMEIWHWSPVVVSVAATSYWYSFPGNRDFFARLLADDLGLPQVPYGGTSLPFCGASGIFAYAFPPLALGLAQARCRWKRRRLTP